MAIWGGVILAIVALVASHGSLTGRILAGTGLAVCIVLGYMWNSCGPMD